VIDEIIGAGCIGSMGLMEEAEPKSECDTWDTLSNSLLLCLSSRREWTCNFRSDDRGSMIFDGLLLINLEQLCQYLEHRVAIWTSI
jgi:hypothetical protein